MHRHPRLSLAVLAAAAALPLSTAHAQALSKGYQILLSRGFQLDGLSLAENGFHLQPAEISPGVMSGGFYDIGYNTVDWAFSNVTNSPNSNVSALGNAPGVPWSRWVDNENNMPPLGNEAPYMSNLVGLCLADEQNLNDQATRDAAVTWFNHATANPALAHTLLYTNSWGGEVQDSPLIDFVTRAHPDMMSFDTYPFQSQWVANGTGQPADYTPLPDWQNMTPFYSELRRYRDISKSFGIPFGAYMQTFSSVQNYNTTVYHDPSPSELHLNNFAAVTFGAKQLVGFTYNSGASSLFVNDHHGSGDKTPTPLYNEQKLVNHKLQNWANTLVRLTSINDWSTDGSTTNTLFLRGKHWDSTANAAVLDPIPVNFAYNAGNANSGFTTWQSNKNDPYLRGWSVTNLGTKNLNASTGAALPGDVVLAWLKPLDESFDGPNYSNEIYMILLNGLSDPTGTVADCTQKIRLNFLATMPGIQMLDPDTGKLVNVDVPVDPVSGRKLWDVTLGGGDAILFKFNDGAPFVGIDLMPEPTSLGLLGGAGAALVLKRKRR